MKDTETKRQISETLDNMPADWTRLTTHRLDIYNEKLAKFEFLEHFEKADKSNRNQLSNLPTAFDYIRLGHPLSCVLEWGMAREAALLPERVISFASLTMPIMAILRRNKFLGKSTQIICQQDLPEKFDLQTVREIYSYQYEVERPENIELNTPFDGTRIVIGDHLIPDTDFLITLYPGLGSVVHVIDEDQSYIDEIQHVRRRESIAMTPSNCVALLKSLIGESLPSQTESDRSPLEKTISEITKTTAPALLSSCGLSIQYAIMMGLVENALRENSNQKMAFVVPPNCYGGTNDQARRVAACLDSVEIVDLPVDSGSDMVDQLEKILDHLAKNNTVAYIIAEIPTNPRVEIPDLERLRQCLNRPRKTVEGESASTPVFILDQTFCPNVEFFGERGYLKDVMAISYVSGSKFPSGGLCTAGYCVANESAVDLLALIKKHLELCDNQASNLQIDILLENMPSMNERIAGAYRNTREFVEAIQAELPESKINFVSRQLAQSSFTPSVFSLDLPSRGANEQEREQHKRELNHKLIELMIQNHPLESKHCVSYGQFKGCYWTIPATSTQGTTKESDKDYIVRVSVGPEFDLAGHIKTFQQFCRANY